MVIDYEASRRRLMDNARQNASTLALTAVSKIENVLKSAEKIPGNLAPILESISYSEASIKQFLKPIVENNSEVFGSCVAFGPYSFDTSQLYFAPYYFKQGDSIVYKQLGSNNYQYFYFDWYQIPEILNKPVWTEPYFDESGGDIIMSTYSVPFHKRTDKNIVDGIVTVDIDLSWLKNIIDSIRRLNVEIFFRFCCNCNY